MLRRHDALSPRQMHALRLVERAGGERRMSHSPWHAGLMRTRRRPPHSAVEAALQELQLHALVRGVLVDRQEAGAAANEQHLVRHLYTSASNAHTSNGATLTSCMNRAVFGTHAEKSRKHVQESAPAR